MSIKNYYPGTNIDLERRPLIKHYVENNRNITIAFTKDNVNNLTAYGAVIFHKCKDTEYWDKKAHVHTAVSRLKKHSVVVENLPKYETKEEYNKLFYVNLRRCVLKFGCKNSNGGRVDWDMPGLS
jgi:hypothetical protein